MPKSQIFDATLKVLYKIFYQQTDFEELVSFYDHEKNIEFIKYIMSYLPKEKASKNEENVEYIGNLTYRIQGKQINLNDNYAEKIGKFFLYYNMKYKNPQLVNPDTPEEIVEQTSDVVHQEAGDLDLTFPEVDAGYDFDNISRFLDTHNKEFVKQYNTHKYKNELAQINEDMLLLLEFQIKFAPECNLNKESLTLGEVKEFLSELYKSQEKDLVTKKYKHLRSLLTNSSMPSSLAMSVSNDSTKVFQEITAETINEAIEKQKNSYEKLASELEKSPNFENGAPNNLQQDEKSSESSELAGGGGSSPYNFSFSSISRVANNFKSLSKKAIEKTEKTQADNTYPGDFRESSVISDRSSESSAINADINKNSILFLGKISKYLEDMQNTIGEF